MGPLRRPAGAVAGIFTKSVWAGPDSSCGLDERGSSVPAMTHDLIAVVIALIMFGLLLGSIELLDRI